MARSFDPQELLPKVQEAIKGYKAGCNIFDGKRSIIEIALGMPEQER
jgi:hypothetical protein